MSSIGEAISAIAASLPSPGKLSEQRNAALGAFRQRGLPTRSIEQWRYTDVSRLERAGLSFALPETEAVPMAQPLPVGGRRIVFVNGRLADEVLSNGRTGEPAIHVLGTDWGALTDGFPRFDAIVEHPLGCINTAATQHGVLIRTSSGSESDETVSIVLSHSGNAELALQPRIVLDLAENSSLRVVLHCVSENQAQSWTNVVVEIRQQRGSRLQLTQLQEQSSTHTQTTLISAALDADASASIGCFDLGASLARNDVDVRLSGRGATARVFGAFLPMRDQHIDTHVLIDHEAADTGSDTVFKGVAGESCRGVFNGKVIVRPDAQRISAEQRSDNLLLAANAEIDTKPELEIYADDVRCSHGATVGELDEQHLFYLRSRGLDEVAARALLTFAFAQSVVTHIEDSRLRATIGERIAQRLPEHERWENLV